MNEKKIFIVRCGEVALKGMNKPYFERVLLQRIKKRLKSKIEEPFEAFRKEGLIYVYADNAVDSEKLVKEVGSVFGVASVSPATESSNSIEEIGKVAVDFMNKAIEERGIKTFKVKAKRADKDYPIKSPKVARLIGASVLKGCKVLKVDVHNPDCTLFVDVRHDGAFLFLDKIRGYGGLPLGTNGKGTILLSGGIDSPVAAWLMAKRGMIIDAVHFHSYPYTSPRALEKVKELAGIIAGYTGSFNMHVVNLLPVQEQIVSNCPEESTTILVRRFMMRIAERISEKFGSKMLITGESLGQVASQTAESLVVTDAAVKMPVMRPLIAMDKIEIMDIAKEIGTYEKSIEPYEDCCTVFLPKHPETKPSLVKIEESESRLDVKKLIDDAVESLETIYIEPDLL